MEPWSAERWRRIAPYLDEALELTAAERPGWLGRLETTDAPLAGDLRALLARHDANAAANFLGHSPLEDPGEPAPCAGETVGAYTLETLVGRGGMGTVWRARRSDGTFESRVAIKILSRRSLGPDAAGQIRREAGLLARLSHPNIARLLDAGIQADGRPYLILEFVDGIRIDDYCEQHALTLAQRLQLFQAVLQAVGHAHLQQVVHRDLKPSNILVTDDGVPKLLDFGVAMLQPLTPQSPPEAEAPAGMTPGYAAPEQIRGESATSASDVYALGVLLHVLITGRHPLGGEDSSATQLVRATLTGDRRLASAALEAGAARHWVRGDLDAVVVRAMEREAQRRYTTAAEFAGDLGRFLSGHAVRARGRNLAHGLRLFVERQVGWVPGLPARERWRRLTVVAFLAALVAGTMLWQYRQHGPVPERPAPFTPPAHSLAVLPFANLSGDAGQGYFSDGLSEELLNALARFTELRVAARTSSFAFRGTHTDAGTIARRLNVGALLEGSVRRSTQAVRISVQLIDAVTGFQLWAQTYDRAPGDALRAQTEIAGAVADALKVALLSDAAAGYEYGGTQNPAAFDAYLRGAQLYRRFSSEDVKAEIAAYGEATRLDPRYALAFAARSLASGAWAGQFGTVVSGPQYNQRAMADARQAIALAPHLGQGYFALASALEIGALDFPAALAAYRRALQLAPGDVRLLTHYARFAAFMGYKDEAVAAVRRSIALDPLNPDGLRFLGRVLYLNRRYAEAIAAFDEAIRLNPQLPSSYQERGLAYYALGNYPAALETCEYPPDPDPDADLCLALAYEKLGRHAAARAAFERYKSVDEEAPFQFAEIEAQWGNSANAMSWLEKALADPDPALILLRSDSLMDPLRALPRFQQIVEQVRFPPLP